MGEGRCAAWRGPGLGDPQDGAILQQEAMLDAVDLARGAAFGRELRRGKTAYLPREGLGRSHHAPPE